MKVRAISGTSFGFLSRSFGPRAAALAPLALALLAALVWSLSLGHVDVRQMNNLGLVSVLPAPLLIAPVILIVSFCMALGQSRLRVPILLLHVVILIVMLYGITTLVQEVPRFRVNYRHAGIIEYIMRNGAVNPRLNAYFNWPGFFILGAFVTQVSGFHSAIAFAAWSPVFFNLLYLGPVFVILSAGTSDRRLVWLGIWFYFLTNWIGQDYFAPQALNYFFYLVIIAILLKWFQVTANQPHWLWHYAPQTRLFERLREWRDFAFAPPDLPNAESRPLQRSALIGLIAAMAVVIAASHQATSLITVASVAALVLFRRCTARGLPILIAVLVLAWISYMATAYMAGHFEWVVKGVGQVDRNINANLTQRLRGSVEHLFIVRMRIVMTLAIGVLAVLGALRRLRQGHWSWTSYLLLIGAPFFVVLIQTYGGEMLLRAYLFALPANAFLAAALFYPSHTARTSWRTTLLVSLTCVGLLAGFFFTRYGNEKADYFTTQEADAVETLYRMAPHGSLLMTASSNTPWKYQDVELYSYNNVGGYIRDADVGKLYQTMASYKRGKAYLLLLRSHNNYNELYLKFPPEDWDANVSRIAASPLLKVVYDDDDAMILTLSDLATRPWQ
jgi:hypothetical protein